jgi:uncharacterized protein (TIGR00369 family)
MEEKSMTNDLAAGREILAAQPFSSLLGTQICSWSRGCAELRIPIADKLKQQHGFVHGGVISYAADNALAFAGASVLGAAVVTSEFKINYVRPAIGDFLIARAAVIYSGKSQAVCRCDVFVSAEQGERLCATSQGTIARLGGSSDNGI